MRLALVQTRPELGERTANLDAMAQLVENVEAEIYCFPELCTTGYAMDERDRFLDLSEKPGGTAGLDFFAELARHRNAAVVAGLPLLEEGRLYNAAGLFRPGEDAVFYRKLHLFAREKAVFDAGDRAPGLWEFRGLRLGMMICFDWVFPEVARLMAMAGADLILHPSNLVTPYCQRAMFARAVENAVFIATVNRVGEERYPDGTALRFTGASQLVGNRGDVHLSLPAEGEAAAVADLDFRAARDKWLTEHNHLMRDRRSEFFGPLAAGDGHAS